MLDILHPIIENSSLNKIAKIFIKKRKKRDAIEFITNESYFTFDEDNQIKEVKLRERLFSHKIVEECMIIANVAASKFIKKNNFPCLYRVHERPPREKVEETANFNANDYSPDASAIAQRRAQTS